MMRESKFLALLGTLIAFATVVVRANVDPLYLCAASKMDGDIHLAHTAASDQLDPAVAALPALGDTALVVVYHSPGNDYDMFARVFESVGHLLNGSGSVQGEVNTYKPNKQVTGFVYAVDGPTLPTFTVAWTSLGGQDGHQFGAYARTFQYSGGSISGLTSEYRLDNRTQNRQGGPTFVPADPHVAVFVWYSEVNSKDIAIRVYNTTSGVALTERWLVDGNDVANAPGGNQDGSSFKNLGSNVYVSAYRDAGTSTIYARIFALDYSTGALSDVVPTFRVNVADLPDVITPEVVVLLDLSFLIIFRSDQQIYMRRYSQDGTALSAIDELVSVGFSLTNRPHGIALPDGGFVIGWDDDGGSGTTGDVYVQRYRSNGEPRGSPVVISNSMQPGSERRQFMGMALMADEAHVVAVWTDKSGLDGSGDGVFGNTYCLGEYVDGTGRIASCSFDQCNYTCPDHSCLTGNNTQTPLTFAELPGTVDHRWEGADAPGNSVLLVGSLWEATVPSLEVSEDAVQNAITLPGAQSFVLSFRCEVVGDIVRDTPLLTYQFASSPQSGIYHTGWTVFVRPDRRFVVTFRPWSWMADSFRLVSVDPVDVADTMIMWTVFWAEGEDMPVIDLNGEEVMMTAVYYRLSSLPQLQEMIKPGNVYLGEARDSLCERQYAGDSLGENVVLYDGLSLQMVTSSTLNLTEILYESGTDSEC